MNIAYIRVSTIEQNEARQIEGLKKYDIDEWFTEKVSAKDTNRPKLQELIKFARKGDTVYVHSLDRLARSTKDLLDIVEQLQANGIHLMSSKEAIDSSTATGKLMLTMIGAINAFERENMLERQREGIAIAKNNGAYKGRKVIEYPSEWIDVYTKYKNRKLQGNEAMELLGLKRTTFYKLVKQYEEG
ncbi:recombinase family protein [Clostridium estertheticum]|uniref:Recombinase family protein n=1 Tax=Clostridium estertheticum TaxID=238834 RepID=A0A5N7IQB9_9CLOT|nr:recombinase family protein [Clostridium estertheticum]MPQ32456.1 recombinase family protein [Clostridium estertheticum]MPQ63115.1 recombinase family protein [Clostridium estertheticum]